jgi:hypothetical protein
VNVSQSRQHRHAEFDVIHMSVAFPGEEHETKYVFTNSRAATLRRFLSMKCIPDGDYAEGLISSIYFDTSHLELLDEKLNSDFLKAKVRLRWYSSVTSGLPYPPVFLEVKRKIGSARRKTRQQLDCFGDWIRVRPLHDPSFLQINALLTKLGNHFNRSLFPTLQIDYRRSRYLDTHSGARLSVDSDIRVSRTNGQLIPYLNGCCLDDAVFECKLRTQHQPDWLGQVNTLADGRKDSFSKYACCFLHSRRLTM